MASQGYRDWIAAGRPYALIRPARALQATLIGHGLTVWDFPDENHQKADKPEDHTPYSVTGWPGVNARWKARGLDIMPRTDTAAGRAENAAIARQLIRDRDAGVPGVMWIKYLNWTDERGVCRQERWMSSANPLARETRSSSDNGHIHVSGRSDADNDARADGYDPIARMTGGADVNLSDKITIPVYENIEGASTPSEDETITVASALGGAYRRSYAAMNLVKGVREDVRQVKAVLAAGGPDLTEQLAAAFVRALRDPSVIAALAKAVNDDAAARMRE